MSNQRAMVASMVVMTVCFAVIHLTVLGNPVMQIPPVWTIPMAGLLVAGWTLVALDLRFRRDAARVEKPMSVRGEMVMSMTVITAVTVGVHLATLRNHVVQVPLPWTIFMSVIVVLGWTLIVAFPHGGRDVYPVKSSSLSQSEIVLSLALVTACFALVHLAALGNTVIQIPLIWTILGAVVIAAAWMPVVLTTLARRRTSRA